MKIEMAEVVAGLESEDVGRLTAIWTALAFERAGGDVTQALEIGEQLGCRRGVEAVIRHVAKLPEGQRGFVHAKHGGAR